MPIQGEPAESPGEIVPQVYERPFLQVRLASLDTRIKIFQKTVITEKETQWLNILDNLVIRPHTASANHTVR